MQISITKGIIKGGINTIELIQGLIIGYILNNLYQNNVKRNNNNIIIALFFAFIMVSCVFIVRELNIKLFKECIQNNMKYKDFIWPSPMLFSFGVLICQTKLKKVLQNVIQYQI